MAVDPAVLRRVAALSHLRLTSEEMVRLGEQLATILEHIEQLLTIDVDPGLAPPLGLDPAPATRADVPSADPLAHPLGEIAPGWRDGFFTVPRVLSP